MYNMESHSELRLDNENKNPIIQAIDQNRPLHTTHNRGRFHIKQIHSSNSSYILQFFYIKLDALYGHSLQWQCERSG